MSIIKTVFYLILLIGLILGNSLLAQPRIISQDKSGIILEYIPEFSPPVDLGDGIIDIKLSNGDVEKIIGQPEMPVFMLNIAVPPGSKPTAQLITRTNGKTWSGRLPLFQPDNLDYAHFTLKPHRVNEYLGDIQLRSFAGVNLARLPIYPVSVGNNQIEIADKMVIKINFNAPPSPKNYRPLSITNLHRLVLLNPEQAAEWGYMTTSNFEPSFWPQGDIYRFEIDDEGIYRINYSDLLASNVNIPTGGLPSKWIKIYGNGGFELPADPGRRAPLGLKECAIYISDGEDGNFGPGDWLIFYGRGAGGWQVDTTTQTVRYAMNHYSLRNVYWLVIDPAGSGKRMERFHIEQPAEQTLQSTAIRQHLEPEKFIFGNAIFPGSGVDWYGYTLDGNTRIGFTFYTAGMDTTKPIYLSGRIVNSTYRTTPRIFVKFNNVNIGDFSPEAYTSLGEWKFQIPNSIINEGANNIVFEQVGASNAQSLFDWIELAYFGLLDRPRITESEVGENTVVEYRTLNLSDAWFFDITDHNNVAMERRPSVNIIQSQIKRRLMVVSPVDFKPIRSIISKYTLPNTDVPNLWSEANRADVVLITPDAFFGNLKPLVEHLRRRTPSLAGVRIPVSQIYNYFSGGLKDPAAIRNLLHYTKDYWASHPRYVIFCGDGDYNYRDIGRTYQPDLLPPYESGALCTDDWFCDFTPISDDNISDPLPEMVHGRLPA